MSEMFDSATGQIPAGATIILLPSDGVYSANNASVKAKFPNATYQTYTAVGRTPAQWIDTEPGCVWPPLNAVTLWEQWKTNGVTVGFYCSTSTRPLIQDLLSMYDHPEWFEADPTGTPHVKAGDAQTQWGWFGSYDETLIAAVPVKPSPPPITPEEIDDMPIYVYATAASTDGSVPKDNQYVIDGCHRYQVIDPIPFKAKYGDPLPLPGDQIAKAA